ncbi:hypothetical protein ES332_D01G033300v1 [Gossypium tomentosum]|uniref:BHLH domain-containing protein n=1 Tax=Gossypium tomentosum TaxID=34277 RepID=A0A5D2M4V9_GOSTO|nr:hypothetical protein ES332_D01G033300v1 [Gossypium tomentosum]
MASTVMNPSTNMNSDRRKMMKKKKKPMIKENQINQSHTRWKSETQQQIFSSKLVEALSQLSLENGSTPSPSAPRGGRAVREATDKALAITAKGKTRWSRAILTGRLKLKFRKRKRQSGSAAAVAVVTKSSRSKKPRVSVSKLKARSIPNVLRKVKVLGRLVPGCRKEPLPVILEEATDYIAALEMQVRAMATLAELLSGSAASSSSIPPPHSPPSIRQ